MSELKTNLLDLGLSDKEANVYLSMLELGPSSVQDVAKKAGVNRATTYVMIESLKRRGLISSVDRGKKTWFSAESPEHLLETVTDELRTVEDKRGKFMQAMPQFMALFNAIEDKPKVRYFEGDEGILACRAASLELMRNHGKHTWRQFIHVTSEMVKVAKKNESERLKLSSGPYGLRVLYSVDPGIELPNGGSNVEARKIPSSFSIFDGEFDVFETFVSLVIVKAKPIAVIIESEEVAKLFQNIFDLAWKGAE